MRVWEEQTDSSVQYAISMALFHVGNQVGTIKKSDPLFDLGVAWQTVGQAAALRTVALQMLHTRMDQEKQRMWAEIGHALILLYIRDLPVRFPFLLFLFLFSVALLTDHEPSFVLTMFSFLL